MTTPPPAPWEAWAPPLDPPTAGGLPYDTAADIANATLPDGTVLWDASPHFVSALQWEAYAATLPPTQAVASVQTGAQAVNYGSPVPGGEFGLAISRAQWHRSFVSGSMASIPLQVAAIVDTSQLPVGVWWEVEPL